MSEATVIFAIFALSVVAIVFMSGRTKVAEKALEVLSAFRRPPCK